MLGQVSRDPPLLWQDDIRLYVVRRCPQALCKQHVAEDGSFWGRGFDETELLDEVVGVIHTGAEALWWFAFLGTRLTF